MEAQQLEASYNLSKGQLKGALQNRLKADRRAESMRWLLTELYVNERMTFDQIAEWLVKHQFKNGRGEISWSAWSVCKIVHRLNLVREHSCRSVA